MSYEPTKVRFIGDIHGHLNTYQKLASEVDLSICLGEMGFRPIEVKGLGLNPSKHIILPGNHDNYEQIPYIDGFLCDPGWGYYSDTEFPDFFYVRGAQSVPWDKIHRTKGYDWWEEEELPESELEAALAMYREIKPRVVVTHTAPQSVVPQLIPPWAELYRFPTEHYLQKMLDCHQPDKWIFGHFHLTETFQVGKTTLYGVDACAFIDLEL